MAKKKKVARPKTVLPRRRSDAEIIAEALGTEGAPRPKRKKRPGPGRTPGCPCYSDDEHLVILVAEWMTLWSKSHVKALVREYCATAYGVEWVPSARTIEKIISKSKQYSVQQLDMAREAWRAANLRRYMSFANREDLPASVRIRAMERIDEIIGTLVPRQDDFGTDTPESRAQRARDFLSAALSDAELVPEKKTASRGPGKKTAS